MFKHLYLRVVFPRYGTAEDAQPFYLKDSKELLRPERNTLTVDFSHVEEYSTRLSNAIQGEYHRLYPYLCNALRNFGRDRAELPKNKEVYVAFSEVPTRHK